MQIFKSSPTIIPFLFFLTLFSQSHILSHLPQLKNCSQFLFSLASHSVAVPKMHSWAIYCKLTEKMCTLPALNSLMDLFTCQVCIKSSKVVHGVGGGYVYFFCMLLQILTHLSSFYCFEDAQLMSQIYYCTIFSSTRMLDSGL